jgi:hypothetical protein
VFLNIALIVVGVLVLAVVILLAIAATKPDTFRIERSANFKVPADRIFPYINDFHSWQSWSPWENIDPALKRTYSGAPSGLGAVYAWEGNKNVGEGRMEITDSAAPSKIKIKLDFLKPFEAHNTAHFGLEPRGDSTTVTWAMDGSRPFMMKVMCLFFNMDNMVGKQFETGLANLKRIAEQG